MADHQAAPDAPAARVLLADDHELAREALISVLGRESDLEIVGEFGRGGRQLGQFLRPHGMSADSQGNLYVGEASTGRRVQKFTLIRK